MFGIHIPVDVDDEELFQDMEIEKEPLFAYQLFQQTTMHVRDYLSLSNRKY